MNAQMDSSVETKTLEEKTDEKKFKVTFIGFKRLETKIMPESDMVKFFENMGFEVWEARRGMIPAFVVTEA